MIDLPVSHLCLLSCDNDSSFSNRRRFWSKELMIYAVLICEWCFRNFWGQLIPTGLSSPFFISSSLAIERTCFTREDQPQAWRRRIQSHIAASSSGLSLRKCWLRTEAAFRPLIRSVRVLFGMPCWRAIFVLEWFSLAAVASFQRAWASVMRSSCESSISSEGMKDVGGVGGWLPSFCWYVEELQQ